MKKLIALSILVLSFLGSQASYIFIPMDDSQTDHLKAYGIAYMVLKRDVDVQWLLNYKGGSFMFHDFPEFEKECSIRGVKFQVIANGQADQILADIADPEVNQDAIKLQKAPRVAVYSPKDKLPWDDAVTLALTYAEIPYELVYDEDVMNGKLPTYDWLHLHHEDFTGQYGRFYAAYHNQSWYQEDERLQETAAKKLGFSKVSLMKLAVAKKIRDFTAGGGYLFAMCSATDSYDIALAAAGVDICDAIYDGDGYDPKMNSKLDYSKCFAFENFK